MSTKNADRKVSQMKWSDVETIIDHMASLMASKRYTRIYAVARGGLVPATMLAHQLGIRKIEVIQAASYGDDKEQKPDVELYIPPSIFYAKSVLILDDIVASGATFKAIRKALHGYQSEVDYAALAIQPRSGLMPSTIWSAVVPEDIWTCFPWERS